MTFKALDLSRPLTDKIPCLKNNGIVAVGRYYTRNKKNRKLLKPDEANELSRAGIHVWAIYQDRQNQLADFSRAKGLAAGAEALEYAQKAIKQPPGSAIYFSVDFDPPKSQYESSVKPFFEGINESLAQGDSTYLVGVYASGLVCQALLDANLVTYTWLTMSRGFHGTPEFTKSSQWNLLQEREVAGFCGLSSVDPDIINPDKPDFGGFVLTGAVPALALAGVSALTSPNQLPTIVRGETTVGDSQFIATLVSIASDTNKLVAMQHIAARKLLDYDGEVYPSDGCAITLCVLLQNAGIAVKGTFLAIDLGHVLESRNWQVIPVGQQRVGDVGSTCGTVPHHGRDHIYLVLKVLNADEMIVADNQEPSPHFGYASGKGRTPTRFFLRAV